MKSTLEGRLQFANGLLYDAGQWIGEIVADEPTVREALAPAARAILEALGAVGEAQKQARLAELAVADAAQEKIA